MVRFINVFVANPTDLPFEFGRKWNLEKLNEQGIWVSPETKYSSIIWGADLLVDDNAPLLYCFRFPVGEYYYLSKGKYRIGKSFTPKGKSEINLYAEFEIGD